MIKNTIDEFIQFSSDSDEIQSNQYYPKSASISEFKIFFQPILNQINDVEDLLEEYEENKETEIGKDELVQLLGKILASKVETIISPGLEKKIIA
jgi:hypothetical protein